ncbi:ASCH domain-containing protein [Candidatus Woesearchaeota archaeon]|nr:ASCH domain-containing protein [Candidatus Woesearchaeota archaeon]
MHHLAILSKKWKLLDLILNGQKTIESRWYQTRRTPWDNIKKGDTIFLKNSGEPVTAKAEVSKVLQFDLKQTTPEQILKIYGKRICINSSKGLENKNYCILIFLKNPKRIPPFNINKSGYGNMSAWITVPNINNLKH